ncbi:tRNA guanosine(34) transglycosylase Tgt [Candidatus Marinamargulisbacteria bacterium SCGC AAA071-K20]|nr:tRNA guanosine(34) transglycosylase Tgt [Candidatus Marinamargulisbacteria bacterium SCGC AAA071-K20]
MSFKFEIIKKSSSTKARRGKIHTNHGVIETPVFMPVGTQATVKSLTPDMLVALGAEIILSNTYHLYLRPGEDLIKKFNGLHDFMAWDKPILTDSGGYQVFSLSKLRKITEEGVTFKSHIDGRKHTFTPKSVIDTQLALNSDIMMPLDICSAYPSTEKNIRKELDITHQWEAKAKDYWEKKHNNHWLFAIVQGGMYKHLREKSAKTLIDIDFPGYAIGGLSVGEPTDILEDLIAHTTPLLPENKPRYVMGLGLPENLEFAINQGADMFDCVIPTRLARHGQVFLEGERKNISRSEFKTDSKPLLDSCTCYTCKHFSRAYLRHLYQAKELLSCSLLSIHNTHYLVNLVRNIRHAI